MSISIKQLHQTTGVHVRRAASQFSIDVTDRGKPVAVLATPPFNTHTPTPHLAGPSTRRCFHAKPRAVCFADLDAVRGDR